MNGETIAMIKALQNKSIEKLKTSGGSADAGKVLTVGSDGRIAPIDLPVGEGQIALDGTLTIARAAAGAKETGDAIRSLNGSLSDANYFVDYTFYDGYVNADGGISTPTSNKERYTSLIEVPADGKIGVILRYPEDRAMWLMYAAYDSNQEYIKRYHIKNSITAKSANEIITIDSRAKFIRFSFRSFNDCYFAVYNPIIDRLNTVVLNTNSMKNDIELSLNSISSVKSVNHRGFVDAPENTLPAYKLSRKMGFTYVETDITFTSDNVPVLLHDTKINRVARNSDGSEISEIVNITEITYEQALAYDFGIYKGEQYAGTKIPTFTEFIILCKRLGLHPYVELKRGSQEQISGLVPIAKRYDMLENITWISFYTSLLGYVKTSLPNARLGYLVDTITSTKIDEAVALKTSENKVFIDTDYRNLTPEIVESCVDADIPLEVYTVDDASAFATIDAYVSGYTSNMLIGSKQLLELYS